MAYAWRRAVRAMAVTSSTTAVAFFANAFSPLLNIAAFGLFAGIIIPINYFLVVIIFPPAVIWYQEKILKPKKCMCWRFLKSQCCSKQASKICEGGQEDEKKESLSRVEKAYDGTINNITKSTCGKYTILLISLAWFVFACMLTSKMEPLSEQEEFIDPESPIMRVFTKIGSEFPKAPSRKPEVVFQWGTRTLNRTNVSFWNTTFKGDLVFDDTFA